MRESAELVIIGGGILGTSAAYHLAKGGMQDVILLEAYSLASGATGKSAAMVLHQTGEKTKARLARQSIDIISQLAGPISELGIDIRFRRTGSILYTTRETSTLLLRSLAAFQSDLGTPTRALGNADFKVLLPWLNTSDVVAATYCELDGVVDAPRLTRGMALLASQYGVSIEENTAAVGVLTQGNKIIGVRTNQGVIATSKVVNAAGSYAFSVGRWFDLDLPLESNRRDLMVVDPLFELSAFPIIEDIDTEWYIRPFDNNGMLIGKGEVLPVGEDPSKLDLDHIDSSGAFTAYLGHRAPLAANGRQLAAWGGIRTFNVSDARELPLLGPFTNCQYEGYYNLCGAGAFGVTLGPVYGYLLAAMLMGGLYEDPFSGKL